MTTLNAAWITERLAAHQDEPERGDHDLNPDARPSGPLCPAAVLVAVRASGDDLSVILTRRTDHLAHHPGQISFPGGHIDAGDASAEAAALREAHEEIGLDPDRVTLIGQLDSYVTRTGFDITPVVGLIHDDFTPIPDPFEVAEVFEVPLAFLLDPANHERHSRMVDGTERHFHAMPYGDYYIWGATAGMLINLYERLIGNPEPL